MTGLREAVAGWRTHTLGMVAAVRSNPTLTAVSAEGFLTRLGFGMAGFAIPLYALALGMSFTEIGLLYTLRTTTTLLVKPLMGWGADRFGRKPTLVIAVALRCLVGLLLVFATAQWHLFAIRILQGVMSAARDPSASALIAEHGDKRRMASAFAWYSTARDLGRTLGIAAAGLLIGATESYQVVFLVAFLTSCAALVTVIRYVRESPAVGAQAAAPETGRAQTPDDALSSEPSEMPFVITPKPSADRDGAVSAAPSGLPYRRLLPYAGFGLMVAGSAEMLKGIYPILATEWAGLTPAQAGLTVAASSVAFLIAGPLFAWLSDNVSRKLALGSRSAANVLSSLMYMLLPNFAGFTFARVVDDTGKAAFKPTWGAVLAEVSEADPRRRARALTFVDTASTSGEIVAPMVAGLLMATVGVPGMLAVRAGIALVTEVQAVWLFKKRRFLPQSEPPAGQGRPTRASETA